jgi:hypothetical protein
MTQEEMKGFIRRSSEQPIKIRLDDGASYLLHHPDFAFTTEGSLILASGPGHELGAEFVVCPFNHIARVEIAKQKRKPK